MKWLFGAFLTVIMVGSFFVFPIAEITYWYGGVFGWIILLSAYAVAFGAALKGFDAVFPSRSIERPDIRRKSSN